MALEYKRLTKNRRQLLALTGLTPKEFAELHLAFRQAYEKAHPGDRTAGGTVGKRKVGGGRKGRLHTTEQKLLFSLVYQKAYPLQTQPGGGAVEIPVAETAAIQGQIGQPGEQDLYKFTAAKAGRYTIETGGPTDLVMSLYGPDSQTKLISEDDDSGVDRNAKIVADITPGTYFVQVRHYGAGGTGSYSIKVSR